MEKQREKLIIDNIPLAIHIAKKYKNAKQEREELESMALEGLCRAAATFRDGKSRFSTYAYTVMQNEIRKEMRKARNRPITVSIYEPLKDDFCVIDTLPEPVDCIGRVEQTEDIIGAIKKLKETEKRVLRMAISGKSQTDIAEAMGISQPYVSRIMKSAAQKIRKECDVTG